MIPAAFTQRLLALCLTLLLAACAHTPASRPAATHTVELDEQRRSAVVLSALSLLDTPYRYGGREPSTGFDCSGLVHYVFSQESSSVVPRRTSDQANAARRVSRSQLRPGDLVFFNTLGAPNSHVGIYIGKQQFINAPSSGGRVRIDSLDNPYFAKRFETARTFFD
ncbi:C40 family peptidase [Alcaligenes faecalis]|uniref:C40 family peptidase n=1 Tax=Alcaligenes faecalis TaxID=511 RepID=UPI002933CE02|nr:C40 family peptidase [Alcaligenes faecalis]MDV2116586.1 C40 family peptidase [Alcaligenes faecalis]